MENIVGLQWEIMINERGANGVGGDFWLHDLCLHEMLLADCSDHAKEVGHHPLSAHLALLALLQTELRLQYTQPYFNNWK